MRAAVFLKQVPDVRAQSVGTHDDGTIDRGSAPAVTNPVDLHALEAGLRLAEEVVAITMGPPAAEAVLRDAIAHGASSGVLLTDRAFAGSDTWATANVLAAAIQFIGGFDLLVCGLTALDGETGQVGPQIAERLGLPHATGCEAMEIAEGRLEVRRVVEGGYERLSLPLPALATVADTGFTPRYPTLPLRRRAAAAEIVRLTADDLGIGADMAGLAASPTKVAHMQMVALPTVDTQYVGAEFGYEHLVASLRETLGVAAPVPPPVIGDLPARVQPLDGEAAVWVVCELTYDGGLAAVSGELLTKGRELAAEIGSGVAAFVAGSETDNAVAEASTFGADAILIASDSRLWPYRSLPHARVLFDAVADRHPQVVLFGATSTGRDLAPRVAARLGTGLAADCTDLYIADWTSRGHTYERLLHQVRPAMAGGVLATCICPGARPQMATVRPGVFTLERAPRSSRIEPVAVELLPEDLVVEVIDRQVQRGDVSLATALVVVAGGAGCSADSWHLVEDLATAFGGRVAASRAAVEAGLAPRAAQVGQTGRTLQPELYIACGISGAIQHVVGMQAAKTIVAINRDPEAAIFRYAHYGIVADVAEALPRLTSALGAASAANTPSGAS